jgi:hypothetical protein
VHFSQECDASAAHPVGSFQTYMKAEAIDGGHRSLLGVNASEGSGNED